MLHRRKRMIFTRVFAPSLRLCGTSLVRIILFLSCSINISSAPVCDNEWNMDPPLHICKRKEVLFHQDNAPCHKSMKKMVKLNKLSFELLPHLLYFPEKSAPRKETWLQWRRDCRDWGLFWERRRIILQIRHWKFREALEWIYYAWRKPCWWIK